MSKFDFDVMFLDHDLGGKTYADQSHPNTGSEVVRWIGENKPNIKRFICHSMNYDARKAMVNKLEFFGYEAWDAPWIALDWDNISNAWKFKED
jgi:hypothetical protein